jgi:hypothetical protein
MIIFLWIKRVEKRGERMKRIFVILLVAGLLLLGSVSTTAETWKEHAEEFTIHSTGVLDVASGVLPCGGGNGGGGAPG